MSGKTLTLDRLSPAQLQIVHAVIPLQLWGGGALMPLYNRKRMIVCHTVIDESDWDWLNQYRWSLYVSHSQPNKPPYVIAWVGGKRAKLHRIILNPPDDLQVDHINGNPLDNRRENLRLVTHQQNQRNQRRITGGTSRYKGVSFHKRRAHLPTPWQSRIMVDHKSTFLGCFATEDQAAQAYDRAALEYFGEHAALNFPSS